MALKFRSDFVEVILQRLSAWRSLGRDRFKVLGTPHPSSPFLTVAEDRKGAGVHSSLIKVLTVPDSDSTRRGWTEVLRWERERLEEELDRRLPDDLQWNRPQDAAQVRDLPLLGEKKVVLEPLSGFRRRDLLEDGSRDLEGERMALDTLVRPYILRPTLADCGYGLERARRLWESYCQREGLERAQNENLLLRHFYREALVIKEPVRPEDEPNLFLTSAWRYARLRGEL